MSSLDNDQQVINDMPHANHASQLKVIEYSGSNELFSVSCTPRVSAAGAYLAQAIQS